MEQLGNYTQPNDAQEPTEPDKTYGIGWDKLAAENAKKTTDWGELADEPFNGVKDLPMGTIVGPGYKIYSIGYEDRSDAYDLIRGQDGFTTYYYKGKYYAVKQPQ